MFCNYFRVAVRFRSCALRYTRDNSFIVPRGEQCTCADSPSTKTLIAHYACNSPRELDMALLPPHELKIPL